MTAYAVIMAGGSGERFWPVSRRNRPKQLLKLTHPDETLLEEAVNRIAPLIPRERVIIATGLSLLDAVREASLVPDESVLAEPAKRNTLGCLAWVAANLLAKHEGEESEVAMAVLTADHKIGEAPLFRDTVAVALETAQRTGGLVTIGIRPTRVETGYGYVEVGDIVRPEKPEAYRAACFREKPDFETATHYLESGKHLWNSGMFFWTLRGFLGEMSHANPEVFATIIRISKQLQAGDMNSATTSFESLPNESVDYALLEKATQVYTVAGEFPWDDVGAWDALERSMPVDTDANMVHGPALVVDSVGTIVYNDEPNVLVTAIGLEDLVVVVTRGAVMICPKSQAQRVKEILNKLPA
ncbi:MAG: mannose-1-phosphate guanylyltransferase, partial [Chlorobia bacterium]|nr:mannose-1-phosphate guanylyltransferase [Fimbriimonadaceae bacterium]